MTGWMTSYKIDLSHFVGGLFLCRSLPSLDNFVILSRLLHTTIEDILVIDGDIIHLRLNYWFNDKLNSRHYADIRTSENRKSEKGRVMKNEGN